MRARPVKPSGHSPNTTDLNADVRDIISEIRQNAGNGVPSFARRLGISRSRLERIEGYTENDDGRGGIRLDTLSTIVSRLGIDPVVFFGAHPRYQARILDPLGAELRRLLSEPQLKELVILLQQLDKLGMLEAHLAALRAFLRTAGRNGD